MNTLVIIRENLRHTPAFDVGRLALGLVERVELWSERHRQREALAALDGDALKDIGLSRADAAREADKPFWRA